MEKKDTRFKPGEGGRPKGSPNKVTKEIKERIEWVLGLLDESLEADLKALKSSEKVKLWLDLQEFVRPKLQRMNFDMGQPNDGLSKITFEVVRCGTNGGEQQGD
ncbi:MAG: hypothetical protein KGZ82_08640 [Bacteroidales bacterium]|nr:hypothetical protein [Bacteroidales bacterium]